jgi:AraC family transcriptional regulator of arabinose operon
VLLHPNFSNDYAVSAEPGYWDKIWAHFYPRFNWEPLLKWPLAATGIGKLATDPGESREKIVQALLQMHELSRGPQYHRAGLAMNALERSLLWCDAINPDSPKRAVDEMVDRVVHLICEDLKIHRSLAELAEASGQSVSRLSHSFKREMGVTPLEFAERQRIDAACRMLGETRLSVKEIAAAVGFENQLYFSRRFRKKMGMTAQEFRRNLWPSDE